MLRLPPLSRLVFWLMTAALLGLAVQAVRGEPVSAASALGALAGYLSFIVAGVMLPRWRMHADSVTRCPGSGIALTFDDGPNPTTTRRVLALLREHGMRATFFVIGRKVEQHPEVVREIVREGHEVALHSFEHSRLYAFKTPAEVVADIERTQLAVREACGETPVLFRPPVGMTSPRTAEGARRAGVRLVAWSVRGYDGLAHGSPHAVLRRVLRGIRPGAIVLLHDAAEHDDFEPASLDVLPAMLGELRARGLTSLRLSDALVARRPEPRAARAPMELAGSASAAMGSSIESA